MTITNKKTPQIINVNEDVEKLEFPYIAGGNVLLSAAMKTCWQFLKKFNIELPYDPVI